MINFLLLTATRLGLSVTSTAGSSLAGVGASSECASLVMLSMAFFALAMLARKRLPRELAGESAHDGGQGATGLR